MLRKGKLLYSKKGRLVYKIAPAKLLLQGLFSFSPFNNFFEYENTFFRILRYLFVKKYCKYNLVVL